MHKIWSDTPYPTKCSYLPKCKYFTTREQGQTVVHITILCTNGAPPVGYATSHRLHRSLVDALNLRQAPEDLAHSDQPQGNKSSSLRHHIKRPHFEKVEFYLRTSDGSTSDGNAGRIVTSH